tara:strand:- start:86 stop:244 length:159 start_codon:yes stop_codon:yes gene_type:complete
MISNLEWLIERFFQLYPEWRPFNDDDDSSSDYCTESDTDSEDFSDVEEEEFE